MRKGRKPSGRPPLGRIRHEYRPLLESEVFEQLTAQSAEAGMPRTTYLERVVALAHNFESPFLRPTGLRLPTAVAADELQMHVADLLPDQCTPVRSDVPTFSAVVRLDKQLGDRINIWCDERDVEYASYVRSILRLAAGYSSDEQLRPQHIQDQLIPYASDRGQAVAS